MFIAIVTIILLLVIAIATFCKFSAFLDRKQGMETHNTSGRQVPAESESDNAPSLFRQDFTAGKISGVLDDDRWGD